MTTTATTPARQTILDSLERADRSRGWLAKHPDNPVGPAATYQFLRGEVGTGATTWLVWLELLGGGVKLPRRRAAR